MQKDNELAGYDDRCVSTLIDGVILAAVIVPIKMLSNDEEVSIFTLLYFLAAVIGGLYQLFSDGFRGQSLGSRVVNIIVVDKKTGQPCTFVKSLVRNLSLMILGFIDLIFIFGKNRQRLGDMLAGTIVVLKREQSPEAT